MTEPPRKRQRRRLNYDKCRFCRNAKKACVPVGRIWPEKCNRCADMDLECSENLRTTKGCPSTSIRPSSQVIVTGDTQKLDALSLRVTWLRRLRVQEKAAGAVLATFEKGLYGNIELWTPYAMMQMDHFISEEETSLSTHSLDGSTYSSNPLSAFLMALLLNTEANPLHLYETYPSLGAVPEAMIDRARESGFIGIALTLRECQLLHKLNSPSEVVTAVELQNYCNLYQEAIDALQTVRGREVPIMPPLHNLLLLTRGARRYPIASDQTQLKDQLGRSLLHVALDLDIFEDTLPFVKYDIASVTEDALSRWPIHIACSKNSKAAVECLLENKADLHVLDQFRRSALHYASIYGNESIILLLLEKGVEINFKADFGQTPLTLAAANRHLDVIRLLLEKGAEIDSKDDYGQTPLSWAAANGHLDVIRLLLEKGAEIDSKDDHGQTPLSWAAANGHLNVVQLLLEKGAEIDSKADYGRTPLSWATANGHLDVIRLLLEKGAEIDSKDNYGQTPLTLAAANGHLDVIRLLLEKGAEIDSKDDYGRTPLSWAAANGHLDVIRLLLKKGAEIDSKPNFGRTPLSWAAANGHLDVVRLLLENGANLHTKCSRGRTPLQYALMRRQDEVAQLLRSSPSVGTHDPY